MTGLVRLGSTILGFGLLLDAVAHGVGDAASAQAGHVVVLVGMVVVLVGVVVDGVRHSPSEVRHAIR